MLCYFWVYSYELFSLPGLLFYNLGAPIIGVGVRPAGEDQQGWGEGLVAGFFLVFDVLCIVLLIGVWQFGIRA